MARMTSDEIREFYDSPLEPERQLRLSRYLLLVAELQSETPNPAAVSEFAEARRSLEEINAQMQADFRLLKAQQARAAKRADEIRQQMELEEKR